MNLGEAIQELSIYHVVRLVNSKVNQPWIFIGRTDDEVESPTLCPPVVESQLIVKYSDAEKGWGQEKGATEDEMVGCIIDSMDMSLSELREIVKDREAWSALVHEVTQTRTQVTEQQH